MPNNSITYNIENKEKYITQIILNYYCKKTQ